MSRKTNFETVPSDAGHYFRHAEGSEFRHLMRYTTSLYDPIFTPLFTALGFGSFSIAGVSGVAIASAIATTALTIGLQALMAPKPPKPEDGRVPKIQSIPYRQWGVGRCRVGGAQMLWTAKGSKLFSVQAIAGHRIKSVNRYWLHEDEVHINSGGVTTEGDRYSSNVQILHRLGNNPETPYAEIVSELSSGGVWTNNHRGDGQASIAYIATNAAAKDQNTRFPYGAPLLSVEADLAYVFDYRISADPANPSAWVWSKNSALIMCWHQCFNEFGHKRDFTRAILPVLDMWIEEADVCDENVALAGGGTEKHYECNGFDTTENDPKVGTNAILGTCDGWICERGDGALLFTVGKFRESRVATLTDADITGHQIEYDVLFEDEINRLIPKFTYPETGYSTSDTDFFEDTAAQLTAGRVLAQEADYSWCHQWRQARRLGKRDWLRVREKIRGNLIVRLSGINAVYARWVRVNAPNMLPRLSGSVVENRKSTLSILQGGFSMDFIKHPANIDEWVPAIDEGQAPPVPEKQAPAAITNAAITSVVAEASGGSVYLRVRVPKPSDASLMLMVRYRVADIGGGVPGDWVSKAIASPGIDGAFMTAATDVVPADKLLEVQVAFLAFNGKTGDWSASETVRSTSDPVAPGVVTAVSVSTGAGTALFSWTAPNSANYAGAKIYWNTTNNFSSATFLGPVEFGSPNVPDNASRSMTAGTRYAWITSVNRAGVESAPVATGPFVVG